MKNLMILSLVVLLTTGFTAMAASEDNNTVPAKQTVCSVSGCQASDVITVDHNGEEITFCCSDCAEKFKKNPDKCQIATHFHGNEVTNDTGIGDYFMHEIYGFDV